MSAERLATLTGASVRTARRWIAAGAMPAGLAVGVALIDSGDLGVIAPAWRGWTLRQDQLYSPENWGFRPGEIRSIPIAAQLIGELRRQLAQPQQFDLLR